MTALRRAATEELSEDEIRQIRSLLWAAFASDDEDERFTEDDWRHALGGTHFLLEVGDRIVSHASVVERELHVAGRAIHTGYVEAVATRPEQQGNGHGTLVMRAVGADLDDRFDLGALGTGVGGFYERLGWRVWRGPTSVRTEQGEERTPDEDGYILVLPTRSSPPLDLDAPISCEWRPGDVW